MLENALSPRPAAAGTVTPPLLAASMANVLPNIKTVSVSGPVSLSMMALNSLLLPEAVQLQPSPPRVDLAIGVAPRRVFRSSGLSNAHGSGLVLSGDPA